MRTSGTGSRLLGQLPEQPDWLIIVLIASMAEAHWGYEIPSFGEPTLLRNPRRVRH